MLSNYYVYLIVYSPTPGSSDGYLMYFSIFTCNIVSLVFNVVYFTYNEKKNQVYVTLTYLFLNITALSLPSIIDLSEKQQ